MLLHLRIPLSTLWRQRDASGLPDVLFLPISKRLWLFETNYLQQNMRWHLWREIRHADYVVSVSGKANPPWKPPCPVAMMSPPMMHSSATYRLACTPLGMPG